MFLKGETGVQTLAASLEVAGAGIILWDDFWKSVSRLLSGATMASVLLKYDANLPKNDGTLVTNLSSYQSSATDPDEEYARKLQAQFDNEVVNIDNNCRSNSATNKMKTDEELARELQAQFEGTSRNKDDSMPQLESATNQGGSNDVSTLALCTENPTIEFNTKPDEIDPTSTLDLPCSESKHSFGDTFDLYYYNGLRGGRMRKFKVTRLTSEEAVGASIALSSGSASGVGNNINTALEDVVRTRWPSCTFDWMGNTPPAID